MCSSKHPLGFHQAKVKENWHVSKNCDCGGGNTGSISPSSLLLSSVTWALKISNTEEESAREETRFSLETTQMFVGFLGESLHHTRKFPESLLPLSTLLLLELTLHLARGSFLLDFHHSHTHPFWNSYWGSSMSRYHARVTKRFCQPSSEGLVLWNFVLFLFLFLDHTWWCSVTPASVSPAFALRNYWETTWNAEDWNLGQSFPRDMTDLHYYCSNS